MQIEQLPGLEADHVSQLRAIGIHSCRQLLRASRRQGAFAGLSKATELSPETLQSVVRKVELCQIRGIGPTTLAQLWEIGVDSLEALANREPTEVQAQLCQVTARPPNLAVIEDWILQARRRKGRRTPRLSCEYLL